MPDNWFLAHWKSHLREIRDSRFQQMQEVVRTHKMYRYITMTLTMYAVFIDDIRYIALPKSADLAVDIGLYVSFAWFMNEICFALVFDRSYASSVMFFMDVIATVSIILPLQISSLTSSGQGNAVSHATRVLRVLRVMRSARLTFGGASMVIDQSAKQRDNERKQQMARELSSISFGLADLEEDDIDLEADSKHPGHMTSHDVTSVDSVIPDHSHPFTSAAEHFDADHSNDFDPTTNPKNILPANATTRKTAQFAPNAIVITSTNIRPPHYHQPLPSEYSVYSGDDNGHRHPPSTTDGGDDGRFSTASTEKKARLFSRKSKHQSAQKLNEAGSSMVGQTLLRLMAEKIIISVLLIAVGLQLLEAGWFDRTLLTGLRTLDRTFSFYESNECFLEANACSTNVTWCVHSSCCCEWEQSLQGYFSDVYGIAALTPTHIKKLTVRGIKFRDWDMSNLRQIDIDSALLKSSDSYVAADISGVIATESIWNIARTVLVMLLLMLLPISFGRDITNILIRPLEAVYDKIQQMARRPFKNLAIQSIHASKRYELDVIELAINKLMKLLQLGLGQAGSAIVARNMDQSGEFNALVDGKRVEAVFGFCDIRNFTDCCEILNEQTMIFTNLIADLVGEIVTLNHGDVNKNIGDAFLVVWKLPPEDPRSHRAIAESALTAFLQIIHYLPRNPEIQHYAKDPAIIARMGPEFRIRMGFGLHVGWAIEGAVGSQYKIDATYLSPHVNLASRLEAATKQYGIPLLMSGQFVDLLPESSMAWCRRVDVVAVKGSQAAMQLYTCSRGTGSVLPERRKITVAQTYLAHYLEGKWEDAKDAIEKFLMRYPGDGPATAILEYIKSHNCRSPEDWQGFRNIDK